MPYSQTMKTIFELELISTHGTRYPVRKRLHDSSLGAYTTLEKAEKCPAEMILIDIGAQDFQNEKLADIIAKMHKSVIIAAKVDRKNVLALNHVLKPYAVDVSDCLEVNGVKNYKKITSFMRHVHSLQGNVIYKLP